MRRLLLFPTLALAASALAYSPAHAQPAPPGYYPPPPPPGYGAPPPPSYPYAGGPPPGTVAQAYRGENCGTPDDPKPCPPLPRVPLPYYPTNK